MQPVYSIKGQLKKFREIKGREKKFRSDIITRIKLCSTFVLHPRVLLDHIRISYEELWAFNLYSCLMNFIPPDAKIANLSNI